MRKQYSAGTGRAPAEGARSRRSSDGAGARRAEPRSDGGRDSEVLGEVDADLRNLRPTDQALCGVRSPPISSASRRAPKHEQEFRRCLGLSGDEGTIRHDPEALTRTPWSAQDNRASGTRRRVQDPRPAIRRASRWGRTAAPRRLTLAWRWRGRGGGGPVEHLARRSTPQRSPDIHERARPCQHPRITVASEARPALLRRLVHGGLDRRRLAMIVFVTYQPCPRQRAGCQDASESILTGDDSNG